MNEPKHSLTSVISRAKNKVGRLLPKTRFSAPAIFIFGLLFLIAPRPTYAFWNPFNIDNWLNFFAGWLMSGAQAIARIVVALMDALLGPLMTYNGFANSIVIDTGWAIVRDTVNLFFVVVLIVIAFGTILGIQRFRWQQQIPALIIAAIVINFSKTIAGIMIDIGQVVMITFANALRDIAGGNLINLLGMRDVISISRENAVVNAANQTGPQAFDFFAAALAAFMMFAIILVVILMLTAILAYRIVMLWVLVVLSPLAFFLGGIKDLVPAAGKGYSEWWSRFQCMVVVGPVLLFFLWLALAVAGAGNIAASDPGFSQVIAEAQADSDASPANLLNRIFNLPQFTSFIIGVAMIFAGIEAAGKFCQGGFVSSALKRGSGFARKAAIAPLAAGAVVGAAGARFGGRKTRQVGGAISRELRGGAARFVGSRLTRDGQPLSGARLARGIQSRAAGSRVLETLGVAQGFGNLAKSLETGKADQVKKLAEGYKNFTNDQKMDKVRDVSNRISKGKRVSERDRMLAAKFYHDVQGKNKQMDKLAETGELKGIHKNLGGAAESYFTEDKDKDQRKAFEERYAITLGKGDKVDNLEKMKKLAATEFAHKDAEKILDGKNAGKNLLGKDQSLWDLAKEAKAGASAKEYADGGAAAVYQKMGADQLKRVSSQKIMDDLGGAQHTNDLKSALEGSESFSKEMLSRSDVGIRNLMQNPVLLDAAGAGVGIKRNAGGRLDVNQDKLEAAISENPEIHASIGQLGSPAESLAKTLGVDTDGNIDRQTFAEAFSPERGLQDIAQIIQANEDPEMPGMQSTVAGFEYDENGNLTGSDIEALKSYVSQSNLSEDIASALSSAGYLKDGELSLQNDDTMSAIQELVQNPDLPGFGESLSGVELAADGSVKNVDVEAFEKYLQSNQEILKAVQETITINDTADKQQVRQSIGLATNGASLAEMTKSFKQASPERQMELLPTMMNAQSNLSEAADSGREGSDLAAQRLETLTGEIEAGIATAAESIGVKLEEMIDTLSKQESYDKPEVIQAQIAEIEPLEQRLSQLITSFDQQEAILRRQMQASSDTTVQASYQARIDLVEAAREPYEAIFDEVSTEADGLRAIQDEYV